MSRNLTRTTLAAALIAAGASTALAGVNDVRAVMPTKVVSGDVFEFVGDGGSGEAIVHVGLFAVGTPVDVSATSAFSIQYYDSDNNMIPGAIVVPFANYSEVEGNADTTVDDNEVWALDLSTILPLAPASAYCFDVIFADGDATDDSMNVATDGIPGDGTGDRDDSSDTRFTIIRTPTLVSAQVDTGADPTMASLFLTFTYSDAGNGGTSTPTTVPLTLKSPDRNIGAPFNAGDPYSNPIDTPDPLNGNTVQYDDNAGFSTPDVLGANFVSNTAIADNAVFVEIIFDATAVNLVGQFVRINPSAAVPQVREESGLVPQGAVVGETLAPFAVSSARMVQTTNFGADNQSDRVRITMNQQVSAVVPSADGFTLEIRDTDGVTVLSDGNLNIDLITIDPNDSFSYLCRIDQGSDTRVEPDGTAGDSDGAAGQCNDCDGMTFYVTVDDTGGTPPDNIFGTGFTGTQTEACTDGIPPQALGVAFDDTNNDCQNDAAILYFNEPVNVPTSTTGWELAQVDGANTQPGHLIDLSNGMLPTPIQTENDTTDLENNEIAIEAGAFTVPDTGTGISARTVDVSINASPLTRFEEFGGLTNGVQFSYNPVRDANSNGTVYPDDQMEPIASTGDANAVSVYANPTAADTVNAPTGNTINPIATPVTDAAGNEWLGNIAFPYDTPATFFGTTSVDRAAPVAKKACYWTQDNQDFGGNENNIQCPFESDGTVGDGNNNRLGLFCSENCTGFSSNTLTEQLIFFNGGQDNFTGDDDGSFDDSDAYMNDNAAWNDPMFNVPTFNAAFSTTPSNFVPGTDVTIVADTGGRGIRDGSNNQLTLSGLVVDDCVAPFIDDVLDVNQLAQTGLSSNPDASGDFVDSIRGRFNRTPDPASFDAADFVINFGGTIASVAVDPDDPNTVIWDVTGQIGINNGITFTYNGGDPGATLIKALDPPAGNGVAVDPVTCSASNPVLPLQDPYRDGRTTASMEAVLNVMNGAEPAPIGTKIYVFNAIPVANKITATHNNIAFTYKLDDSLYGPWGFGLNWDCGGFLDYLNYPNIQSLEAFTNWLQGIFPDVYLSRDECNHQYFTNSKVNQIIDADFDSAGLNAASAAVVEDVIYINLGRASRSLSQGITFTGTGETRDNSVRSGRVDFAWDVIRGNWWYGNGCNGTLNNYYATGFGFGGSPIIAGAAVIDNNNGDAVMHITRPVPQFTTGTSNDRLSGIDRPLIFVAEFPDGTRCAMSSLLMSATTNDFDGDGVIGDSILFSANNLTQSQDGTVEPFTLNFDLARVSKHIAYPEWNVIPVDIAAGVASSNRSLPALPAGVTSGSIVEYNTSTLPLTDPLDAAAFWFEGSSSSDRDGIWTAADDDVCGFMSSLAIDADQINHFAFTMTTNGIALGDGIESLVGGYAVGFYNGATVPFFPTDFGVQMFGAPLAQTSVFTGNPVTGNSARSSQGWILGAVTNPFADPTAFFTANPGADYVLMFRNMGRGPRIGTAPGNTQDVLIEIRSADTVGPNDAEEIGPEGAFIHYAN